MPRVDAIPEIVRALERGGARCALGGGFAVSLRVAPRFTKDVDFAVAVGSDAEAESLLAHLIASGFKVDPLFVHKTTQEITTARVFLPGLRAPEPDFDLLFAATGIERDIVARAVVEELARGIRVPVATVPDLIAMKLVAESPRWPNDAADLLGLLAIATSADLAAVERAISAIETRGLHPTIDLRAKLEHFRRLAAEPHGEDRA